MTLNKKLSAAFLTTAVLIMGGCTNTSSNVYTRDQAMTTMTVQHGVVDGVRDVTIEGSRSGVGTVAGAAIGGIAGSNIGGGRGAYIGTIAGVVAGGLAGRAVEESTTRQQGQEVTVRLDNGSLISVVQTGQDRLRQGDRVRVMSGRGDTRVVRD